MAKDSTPALCEAQGLQIGCPGYDPLAGVPVGTSEGGTGKTRGEHGMNTGVRPRPRHPNTGVARPPTRGPHGGSTGPSAEKNFGGSRKNPDQDRGVAKAGGESVSPPRVTPCSEGSSDLRDSGP